MSFVLFEVKSNIGYITLNRPDKLNSFNREMALQMQEKSDGGQAWKIMLSLK